VRTKSIHAIAGSVEGVDSGKVVRLEERPSHGEVWSLRQPHLGSRHAHTFCGEGLLNEYSEDVVAGTAFVVSDSPEHPLHPGAERRS